MSIKTLTKFATKSFTLPDTCVRLRDKINDPRSSADDIGAIISVDPSLSAKVLKLANSALFRFPSQIETVPKALSVIGGEAAYNISIAETANVAFQKFETPSIDFQSFWNQAVMFGLVAKSIAQQAQIRGSERFFALGILQALSELLVAIKFEDKYERYLSDKSVMLPSIKQQSYFKYTFAQCSGHICEAWGLPESLTSPLQRQCFPPTKRFDQTDSVLYASMALLYADAADIKCMDLPKINEQALANLELSEEDYAMVLNFAKLEATKIANLLN
ncbi:HDOD domain-containing protein [Glaciecola sp. KUL10]|uniref:HDOD domain-containing protein n=1 Tax=Glaciecola sp. (strain KUL10) TaxID=2161813 RepID=UPI000D78C466|nr:HDOD domain-containing protein [Glaciecola sp. KUL10]